MTAADVFRKGFPHLVWEHSECGSFASSHYRASEGGTVYLMQVLSHSTNTSVHFYAQNSWSRELPVAGHNNYYYHTNGSTPGKALAAVKRFFYREYGTSKVLAVDTAT